MTKLVTTPNLSDPDHFYQQLLDLHKGLDRTKSEALNARLVMILANHIGDPQVLEEAMETAGTGS